MRRFNRAQCLYTQLVKAAAYRPPRCVRRIPTPALRPPHTDPRSASAAYRPPVCVKPVLTMSVSCPLPHPHTPTPLQRLRSEASAARSAPGNQGLQHKNASVLASLPLCAALSLPVALSLRRLDKAQEGVVGLKLPNVEVFVLVQTIRHLPKLRACCTVRYTDLSIGGRA
jgi:hypothetical protein